MATSIFQRAIVATLPLLPEPVIWQFSRRYIADTRLADACDAVAELNTKGCSATMDVLGEDSTDPGQVESALALYRDALDGIAERSLDCGVSVKLSEMGLRFDEDRCRQAVESILGRAARSGNFVRIDMEDSSVTTATLDMYRRLRGRFDNVGAVIQACLRRSEDDVRQLLDTGPTSIRLCKGIYIEPEEIAYVSAGEIRDSFSRLLQLLFEGGAFEVAIATHDPELVTRAEEMISRLSIGRDRYEFQMLLGVAERLRTRLTAEEHPMRVYVPFGERWLNYSMRRLRENPRIVNHIVRNLFSLRG